MHAHLKTRLIHWQPQPELAIAKRDGFLKVHAGYDIKCVYEPEYTANSLALCGSVDKLW